MDWIVDQLKKKLFLQITRACIEKLIIRAMQSTNNFMNRTFEKLVWSILKEYS